MLNDILVHIPSERAFRPVVDAAVSLASTFNAHVDAIATSYVLGGTSYAIPPVKERLDAEQRRAVERSRRALELFETTANGRGVSYECRSMVGPPARVSSSFGEAARVRDLTVALQPGATDQSFDDAIATEALFQSGGPVLFIPADWAGSLALKRIGVLWDGSMRAGRALRDARPFLSRAHAVVIVAVDGNKTMPTATGASKLGHHLERVGLAPELLELTVTQSDVAPLILSAAGDEEFDMLVMGAYGHSRIWEELFGGVTQEMLSRMPVPTLMSH